MANMRLISRDAADRGQTVSLLFYWQRRCLVPPAGPLIPNGMACADLSSGSGPKAATTGSPPRSLAAPRRLDCSNVDLSHAHHRSKRALCFIAANRQRFS